MLQYDVGYKPAPGEPYRPVLLPPSRLSSLLPEWSKSGCVIQAALFNGVDPPRALKPAEVLTPRITQSLPLPSTSVAAASAAPASPIRVGEPSKTSRPSTIGEKGASVLPDPDTKKSGSGIPALSSSDSKHPAPQDIDHQTSKSRDFDTDGSNANNVRPLDTKATIPTTVRGVPDASKAEPQSPENLDTKHAASQRFTPQPQNGLETPKKTQGPSPKVTESNDPKPDTSDPERFRYKVFENPSNTVDSSNGESGNVPSDGQKPDVSNTDGMIASEANLQEAADSNADDPELLDNGIKATNSIEKDTAISLPHKSPVIDPEASSPSISILNAPDDEVNLFHVLPPESPNNHGPLAPKAQSSGGQHSRQQDSQRPPLSQIPNLRYPQPGFVHGEDGTADKALPLEYLAQALPAASSNAAMDRPIPSISPNEENLSSQNSTNDIQLAKPDAMEDSPRKTASADRVTADVTGNGRNEIKTADAAASVTLSAHSATTSRLGPTSATVAASGLPLGGGELSDSEDQGEMSHPAASSAAKGSRSRLWGIEEVHKRPSPCYILAVLICCYHGL